MKNNHNTQIEIIIFRNYS